MTGTATFILIFLVAFVLIGGVVMYLSRTIEHGEARFDASGRVITDEEPDHGEPACSAKRAGPVDKTGTEQ
ncbi:hypothetical protein U4960_14700 [Altererythrobacter sp. H2]|uniref:hypothetical protein n=1 Tax=Altererythrobacter sp. H2 TaxID=3108391 RepID=UPI002B4C1B63|nr:hypothetical protein [Altererythrobacter sp. H2]WRK95512.1 hypothetical protein U4960_14700 [Altererythrobacter sp. H2]